MQTSDVDADEAISTVEQSAPYLVITGTPGSINCQVFIGCEQEIFFECSSIRDSIIDLIGTYFVFNISYPKYLNSIFLFIQHFVKPGPHRPHAPGFLKLILCESSVCVCVCVYVCVCVCVRVHVHVYVCVRPEAINNLWRDMDLI